MTQSNCTIFVFLFNLDDPQAQTHPDLQKLIEDRDNRIDQALFDFETEEEAITRRFDRERKIVNDAFIV